jgi:hypothetical protein
MNFLFLDIDNFLLKPITVTSCNHIINPIFNLMVFTCLESFQKKKERCFHSMEVLWTKMLRSTINQRKSFTKIRQQIDWHRRNIESRKNWRKTKDWREWWLIDERPTDWREKEEKRWWKRWSRMSSFLGRKIKRKSWRQINTGTNRNEIL